MPRSLVWKLCCLGMIAVSVICFSPWVIPPNKYQPMFVGLPYTLWAGIAISIVMFLLTLFAAICISGSKGSKES